MVRPAGVSYRVEMPIGHPTQSIRRLMTTETVDGHVLIISSTLKSATGMGKVFTERSNKEHKSGPTTHVSSLSFRKELG